MIDFVFSDVKLWGCRNWCSSVNYCAVRKFKLRTTVH